MGYSAIWYGCYQEKQLCNLEFAVFSPGCKPSFSDAKQHGCVLTQRRVEVSHWVTPDVASLLSAREKSAALAGHPDTALNLRLELGRYELRLAQTLAEREAACRLRFSVFNIELGKGLAASCRTGMDNDSYDSFCEHLIVEDRSQQEVVGTYRMQSGRSAGEKLGYYSEQEFDFAPYEAMRGDLLELGRAAIHQDHRTSEVLTLLWRGIAQFAGYYRLRYLMGCSSLNTRDPQVGWSIYRQLNPFLAPESLRTRPMRGYELPAAQPDWQGEARVPKLLRTYIAVGAKICAAPAWDRDFGTIDFLTLLDLEQLSPAARSRFMPAQAWSSAALSAC